MPELLTQFMAAEQGGSESAAEQVLDPELTQARLRAQTIQRFKALNSEIANISDLQQQEEARGKLDALAMNELGNVWEVLKKPDVEVRLLMIGGKTKEELKQELIVNGYKIEDSTEELLDNPDFVTLAQPELVALVRLIVGDLGFSNSATTYQLYVKAKKLGLELCPPELGPQYRLQTPNQPIYEYLYLGMKPIADLDGFPHVFSVVHDRSGRWLEKAFAAPSRGWDDDNQLLFRLPLLRSEPAEANHV